MAMKNLLPHPLTPGLKITKLHIDVNVRTLPIKDKKKTTKNPKNKNGAAAFQSKISSRLYWAIYDNKSPPQKLWNEEEDGVWERMRRMKMRQRLEL